MEWRIFFDVGITVLVGAVGYVAKELWNAMKELRNDIRALEVTLPKEYVSKEDYKTDLVEIKKMLEKISDKLDDKADKS